MPRQGFLSYSKSKVGSAVNNSHSPWARELTFSLVLVAVAFFSAQVAMAQSPATTSPSAATYSNIVARSAALSPGDKARAQQLFANAFALWRSGEFAAAEIGFKIGLDIDPANATANYYYGDSLARRKAKADARVFLSRAVAFGGVTTEALKAQAEIDQLSIPPTSLSDMSQQEITEEFKGNWQLSVPGAGGGRIIFVAGINGVAAEGKWSNFPVSCNINGKITVSGYFLYCNGIKFMLTSFSAERIAGTWNGMPWYAVRLD